MLDGWRCGCEVKMMADRWVGDGKKKGLYACGGHAQIPAAAVTGEAANGVAAVRRKQRIWRVSSKARVFLDLKVSSYRVSGYRVLQAFVQGQTFCGFDE